MHLKNPDFVNDLPVHYRVGYMDEWVDELVAEERVVDLAMPYLAPRQSLVSRGEVPPRRYLVSEESGESESERSEESEKSDYESDSE